MSVWYSSAAENQRGSRRVFVAPIVLVAVVIAVLVAEMHWPNRLLFGQAKPDLLLLLVLYFAFSDGPAKAMGIGLVVGALEDMLSGGPFGLSVFCKVLIGYTVGVLSGRLVTEHPVVMTAVAFLSTICQAILRVLLSFLYLNHVPVRFMFLEVGVPMAFYNSVLAPLYFYCFDRLWRKMAGHAARWSEDLQGD